MVFAMVWSIAPPVAFAANTVRYAVEGGNIYFDTTTGTITGCDNSVTSAVIPEQIQGVKVTAIGNYAFGDWASSNSMLRSISIPNSVTSIEHHAFSKCHNLNSINIPNSVISIAECAFSSCTSLSSINISNGVTSIGNSAFSYCTSLSSINIPNSVTSIGNNAFLYCTSLSNVNIPYGIKYIMEGTFSECRSLSSISIPDNITFIGERAFSNCTSLSEISIPASVTNIASRPFIGYTNLSDIYVDVNNKKYCSENGVLFNKNMTYLLQYPVGKKEAIYVIPKSVTSIADSAFYGCTNLSGISIPDSVKDIRTSTFGKCTGLNKINIPNSVTSIGEYAFGGCTSLSNVNIPHSVTSIGERAFRDCTSLQSISIPNSVASIKADTFGGCTSLSNISIPEGVTSIGEWAFSLSSSISINIPNSVTSIGKYAFYGCASLSKINIPNTITFINEGLFSKCISLSNISIPEGVTSIGERAFEDCTSLSSISIPRSIRSIKELAFSDCTSLTDVYYDGTETEWEKISIGKYGNTYLKKATIHFAASTKIAQNIPTDKYGILVIDSAGKAISGAKVQWNNSTQTTSDDGIVFFDKLTVGQPSITVTCNGYEPYSNSGINYAKNAQGYDVVRLYKADEASYKLKSAVYTAGMGQCDVLNGTKRLSTSSGDDSFTLSCKADGADIAGYTLLQNDTAIKTSANGEFSLRVNELSVGGNVDIMVTSTGGKTVRTHINLELVKDQAQKYNSIKLGGRKLTFTVSSDFPYVGGSQLTIDLPEFSAEWMDVYIADDTVHVGINCKLAGEDKDKWKANIKEAKKLFTNLKQVQKNNIGDSLQAKINYMMKDKNKHASVGPLKVKCNFIGYGEGKLDKNGLANVKVYLCLTLSGSKSMQGPTVVVVCVPMTYSMNVSAEGKLLGEGSWNLRTGTLNADLKMTIKPKFEAFLGAGIGSFTGAGAYGSAELPIDIQLLGTTTTPGVNSVDLTGNLGLKIYVGAVEYKKSFAYQTWHLYTRTKNQNSNVRMYSANAFDWSEMFDADAYQTADISYLAGESDWLGEQAAQAYAVFSVDRAAVSGNELQTLQIDTYRNMQPVLGDADGTPVMVWVRANEDRGDYDYPQLVYSVYGNTGWSAPQPVDSDNTCDAAPVLYKDSTGKLWLAYQNSSTVTTDSTDLADYAAKQTITAGYFDKASGKFTGLTTLSENGVFSRTPVLGEMNGAVTVAWQANSDSTDYFGQNSTNALCYVTYSDDSWSEVHTAGSNVNAITEIAVGDSELYTITDSDNDLSTADDRQLKRYSTDGASGNIAEGTVSAVQFAKLPGASSKAVLWSDGEALCRYDSGKTETVVTNEALSNGYTVLSDRLLYNAADEGGSELFAQIYENGNWRDPVAATEQDKYLQSYSAAEIDGVTWLTAVQADVTITEDDVTDTCDLVWAKLTGRTDIAISAVTVDHSAEAPGGEVPVEVDLTNCGDTAIDQVTLRISNGNTQIAEQTVDLSLAPGETKTENISFRLSETVSETNYTVTAVAANDGNTENNSADFTAGYCDLTVSAEFLQVGDSRRVLAKVTNQGAASSSGTLEISGSNGTIVNTEIASLASGESTYVVLNLSQALLGAYSDVLSLTANAVQTDADELNNTEQLYVALEHPESAEITDVTSEEVSVEVYNKQPAYVYLAIYDSEGKLLYHFEQAAAANAGTIEFPLDGADLPEGYVMKAFVLRQSDRTPLMEPAVRRGL